MARSMLANTGPLLKLHVPTYITTDTVLVNQIFIPFALHVSMYLHPSYPSCTHVRSGLWHTCVHEYEHAYTLAGL